MDILRNYMYETKEYNFNGVIVNDASYDIIDFTQPTSGEIYPDFTAPYWDEFASPEDIAILAT